jgi:hypothetical protein
MTYRRAVVSVKFKFKKLESQIIKKKQKKTSLGERNQMA